jgi:hypothetical protein
MAVIASSERIQIPGDNSRWACDQGSSIEIDDVSRILLRSHLRVVSTVAAGDDIQLLGIAGSRAYASRNGSWGVGADAQAHLAHLYSVKSCSTQDVNDKDNNAKDEDKKP